MGFIVTAPVVAFVAHKMNPEPQAECSTPVLILDTLSKPDTVCEVVPDSVPPTPDTLLNPQQHKTVRSAAAVPTEPVVVKKTIVVYDTVRVEKTKSN